MHDILFLLIGGGIIFAFVVAVLVTSSARAQPTPTIIYVQANAPEPIRRFGCLPLIVGGVLVLIALRLLANA